MEKILRALSLIQFKLEQARIWEQHGCEHAAKIARKAADDSLRDLMARTTLGE